MYKNWIKQEIKISLFCCDLLYIPICYCIWMFTNICKWTFFDNWYGFYRRFCIFRHNLIWIRKIKQTSKDRNRITQTEAYRHIYKYLYTKVDKTLSDNVIKRDASDRDTIIFQLFVLFSYSFFFFSFLAHLSLFLYDLPLAIHIRTVFE
jgi:hypothetical protein